MKGVFVLKKKKRLKIDPEFHTPWISIISGFNSNIFLKREKLIGKISKK
jgi:hypothetical protein